MAQPEGYNAAQKFGREHPEIADQVTAAVHKWFGLCVDNLTNFSPPHIVSATAAVLWSIRHTPDDAYVGGNPLSTIPQEKRTAFVQTFRDVPKSEYIATFLTWRHHNFYVTEAADKRNAIEETASLHVYFWLQAALPEHREYENLIPMVEDNLTAFLSEGTVPVLFETGEFLGCIETAIVEEFIADTYTPPDLYDAKT